MTENHGIGVRLLSLPWLQELEAATLHGERAGYCGNDGCDEFQHLKDGVPFYFDHLRIYLNTDYKDYKEYKGEG